MLDGHTSFHGVNSEALYPDYWTDPSIMVCPSDARSDMNGFPGIEESITDQIGRVSGFDAGGDWTYDNAKQLCINGILSHPVSYIYNPVAVQTASEQLHAALGRIGDAYLAYQMVEPGDYADAGTLANIPGCENLGSVSRLSALARTEATGYGVGDYRNDDGTELSASYPLLREGIERFFITDINNPGAGAQAQSNLAMMYDAWADSVNPDILNEFSAFNIDQRFWDVGQEGVQAFNHVPGGANVLYMDGHVQFVRFGEDWPVEAHINEWGNNLGQYIGAFNYLFGGVG